jgi:hypothetical protein
LNNRALVKWNNAINKKITTIHEPLREVISDLLYEQSKTKAVTYLGGISVTGSGQPIFYVGYNKIRGFSTFEFTAPPNNLIQILKDKTDI